MPVLEFGPRIAEATAKVLESMYFTSILDEGLEPAQQEVSWIAAKLDFQGNPSGSFGIGVSPESARSLTANFLGVEAEELSQTQVNEVVGELTNMIAGSLVSHFESDGCFTLSHPEMESSDDLNKHLQASDGRIFPLEDGSLAVWLQINS